MHTLSIELHVLLPPPIHIQRHPVIYWESVVYLPEERVFIICNAKQPLTEVLASWLGLTSNIILISSDPG